MSCQHENLDGGKCTSPGCDYCLHEVKFGGLCAVCGRVIEDETSDQIKMTHKDIGITVSLNEAKRLEQQDEKRLLEQKKLSLIVDLDQTILHATWEPSIADWVKERKVSNSDSVRDIKQFTLDGSPLIYSIKLRPGLSEFLRDMSKKYEMHIYTMGTRSYAEAVVKEIDPTGILFQDRILSRDENGSMTKKRLERLFPSDTSKVVVLDDRGDVWDYSPNLIQIKPYEYFIGIGDINSPFAQPKKDIIPSAEALAEPSKILESIEQTSVTEKNTQVNEISSVDTNNIKNKLEIKDETNNKYSQDDVNQMQVNNKSDEINNKVDENADKVVDNNNRKAEDESGSKDEKNNSKEDESNSKEEESNNKEEESNSKEAESNSKEEESNSKEDESNSKEEKSNSKEEKSNSKKDENISQDSTSSDKIVDSTKDSTSKAKDDHVFKAPAPIPKPETHLPNTHDSDDILRVTRRALLDVHNIFFNDLKRNQRPQVSIILNSLKRKVLKDVNVVFSGIIPLHQTKPEESWIWRMATSFGANCFHELTGKVTHLIAANPGTDKAITARKYGHIKIVSPAWITDSVWNWQRQDETKYLLPILDISPAESDIEDPESTQLEIDFDWEDDEVDEVLGDESEGGINDDDDDDEDFNIGSSEIDPLIKETIRPLSMQQQVNNDSEDDDFNYMLEMDNENNNKSDNSDDEDMFDEESLNADLDEMFANEEDDDDEEEEKSSFEVKKRDRDDSDDSDDEHPFKKQK
ncbi:hypothetical protein BD770DRAFT_425557 [Pilaira anomala]|nr:hypothetical protein BD770DRAFT_425557 [Pilaira anomala]